MRWYFLLIPFLSHFEWKRNVFVDHFIFKHVFVIFLFYILIFFIVVILNFKCYGWMLQCYMKFESHRIEDYPIFRKKCRDVYEFKIEKIWSAALTIFYFLSITNLSRCPNINNLITGKENPFLKISWLNLILISIRIVIHCILWTKLFAS